MIIQQIQRVRCCLPADTKHLYNICTMSAQRFRRWSNIVQFMLYNCFVFAGICATHVSDVCGTFLYNSNLLYMEKNL